MTNVDRRTMLRNAFSSAIQGVAEIRQSFSEVAEDVAEDVRSSMVEPKASLPARPTTQCADLASAHDLIEGSELDAHRSAVVALARRSIRLSAAHGVEAGRSHLGGAPGVTDGFDWPQSDGRRLGFIGQIDLDALPEGSVPIPESGLLLFFYDTERRPRGQSAAQANAGRALLVDGTRATPYRGRLLQKPRAAYPLELSAELVLPSPWSSDLDPFELAEEELVAWGDLASRLAALQGVADSDPAQERAVHRLLGYPDDVEDDMPLICELLERGLDVGDHRHSLPSEVESEARGEWQLLLQVSRDDELGTTWLRHDSKLYFWIRRSDLREGDFSRVRALLS